MPSECISNASRSGSVRSEANFSSTPIIVLDDDENKTYVAASCPQNSFSPNLPNQTSGNGADVTIIIDSDLETDVEQTCPIATNIQTENRMDRYRIKCKMKHKSPHISVIRCSCSEDCPDKDTHHVNTNSSGTSNFAALPDFMSLKTPMEDIYKNCDRSTDCNEAISKAVPQPDSTTDMDQNATTVSKKRSSSKQSLRLAKRPRRETSAVSYSCIGITNTTSNIVRQTRSSTVLNNTALPNKRKKNASRRYKNKLLKTNRNSKCLETLQNIGNIMVNFNSEHRKVIYIANNEAEKSKKEQNQGEHETYHQNSAPTNRTVGVLAKRISATEQNLSGRNSEESSVLVQCQSKPQGCLTKPMENEGISLAENQITLSNSEPNNVSVPSTRNAPLGSSQNPIIIFDQSTENPTAQTSKISMNVSSSQSLGSNSVQQPRLQLPSFVGPSNSVISSTLVRQVIPNLFNIDVAVPFATPAGMSCQRLLPFVSSESQCRATENVLRPLKLLNKLRPIAIDGSNVAYSHGKNGVYSCRGIQLCIDYFAKRGHATIKAFVPQFRRRHSAEVTHQHILEELGKKQVVVFTPSREIFGNNIASYDDRFIIEYASKTGAVIVSNDNFRDLMGENPIWKEVIISRLLMYTFADDIFMVPQDPLGRNGPTLDEFLSF